MQISPQGTAFVAAHEGLASKAYRCPAGVVTIGYGFTMGSRAFAAWWQRRHGRALQMGDTLARADADTILATLLNSEYGAAVTAKVKTAVQHQWDGATSVAFNCGTGALGWRWAAALAAGKVTEAATLLRTTATTANGRQLPGLVRRRKEEAKLIETGDYGKGPTGRPASVSTDVADVKWYQERLRALGYAIAAVDGIAKGSDAAVRKFQADNGLVVDGKVGPATRAAIIRALDAKATTKATATGGTAGGGTAAGADVATAPDPAMADVALTALYWGLGIAAAVLVLFLLYRYRGAITARRVPT